MVYFFVERKNIIPYRYRSAAVNFALDLVHAIVRQEVVSTVFCHCYIGEEVDLEVLYRKAITMYGKEVNMWRLVFQHTGGMEHATTHTHTRTHLTTRSSE
jgi:hypothetical protein